MSNNSTSNANVTKNRSVDQIMYQIRSELMQDYIAASPLDLENPSLVSCSDADGRIQLYSKGTNGVLYNLFSAVEVKSGWRARPIDMPFEPVSLAVGKERFTGTILIVACDGDGSVYWKADSPWSSWQEFGELFGGYPVLKVKSGYDENGDLIFQALTQSPSYASSTDEAYNVIQLRPRDSKQPWDYVSQTVIGRVWDFLPGVSTAFDLNDGSASFTSGAYVSAADALRADSNVTFFGTHAERLRTFYSSLDNEIVDLFGAENAGGSTDVFFLDELGKAYYLDPLAETGNNLVGFNSNQSEEPLTYETLAVSHSTFSADANHSSLDFFGLTNNGQLYHSRLRLAAGADSWSSLVMIGDGFQVGAGCLTTVRDEGGVAHCFAVTEEGGLVELTLDENSQWQVSPVILPSIEAETQSYPTYSTEVTVLDSETELPVQNYTLHISASTYMNVEINGKKTQIGPNKEHTCDTNAAGRFTVSAATASLANANYRFTPNSGDIHSTLVVSPSRYIQDQLCPLSEQGPDGEGPSVLSDSLKSATYISEDGDEFPLLAPDTDYNAVADSVWNSMTLAQLAGDDVSASESRIYQKADTAGVQYGSSAQLSTKIAPHKVRPQHWRIHYTKQGPEFTAFASADEAEACIKGFANLTRSHELETFSLPHLHIPTWGDVVRGVKQDIQILEDVVVTTVSTLETVAGEVVNKVKAVINVLVDGVYQAVEYVVDSVEQVFDLVEMTFQSVAAEFDKLFGWLGSLFGWDEILDLHDAIRDYITGFYDTTLTDLIENGKEKVDEAFDGLKDQIANVVGGIGEDGDSSMTETLNDNRTDDPQIPGPSSNWTENKLLNSGGGVPGEATAGSSPESIDPLTNFISQAYEDLSEFGDDIVTSLSAAVAQGESIDNASPNQILALAGGAIVYDLVSGVQTCVDLSFDFAEFTVNEIASLGETKWDIPVVSKLYKELTGDELTLFDLVSLAIAMPASPLLKITDEIRGVNSTALLHSYNRARVTAYHNGLQLDLSDESILELSYIKGVCHGTVQVLLSPVAFAQSAGIFSNKYLSAVQAVISGAQLGFSCPVTVGFTDNESTGSEIATSAAWGINALLWIICDTLPAALEFKGSKEEVNPETQPLLGGEAKAVTSLLQYVLDIISCGGGLILGVGYGVQAVVQVASDDYLPNATPAQKSADLIVKTGQNFFGVLPRVLAPLSWPWAEGWGKPTLGGIAFVGAAGGGAMSVIRVTVNANGNNFNHVI